MFVRMFSLINLWNFLSSPQPSSGGLCSLTPEEVKASLSAWLARRFQSCVINLWFELGAKDYGRLMMVQRSRWDI